MLLAGEADWTRTYPCYGPASKPDQRIGSCLPHIMLAEHARTSGPTSSLRSRPARDPDGAGCLQAVDFFLRESTELTGWNVQCERTVTHALDFLYVMAHSFEHAPDLAIASLDQGNFIPRIRRLLHDTHSGRARLHSLAVVGGNRNSRSQFGDSFFFWSPGYLDQICLRNMRSRLHQPVCEFAVISQDQQTFAGIIKPPHGVNSPLHPANQIHHRRTLLRVAHRSHESLRLVQQKVHMPLRSLKKLSVHADVVGLRVSLASQFGDCLAIYKHVARRNELLCLAPRSDSGGSDNFLQTLSRHSVTAFDPR